jgi:phosphonate degradation associated HDIG domain protein
MDAARSIDEIFDLYERYGADHYDEDVSQLAHALQSADLARDAGAADALVAAALLHDVGHLLALRAGMALPDDLRHEAAGARYLSALFGADVTQPIALHVTAKRFRCAADPAYHDQLSNGSKASLVRQGGPLDTNAADAFARTPGFEAAVTLRDWDDRAKVPDRDVLPFAHYLPVLERASV